MKEVTGETVTFFTAGQVVEQLSSINSPRALSRWAKLIEDSTSYTFKRKSNSSRIYTSEDVEKFLAVDAAYSKSPESSIDELLIANFSLVADTTEPETTSMPLNAQVLKTLAVQNEQLFKQNELLAEKLENVEKELSDLKQVIESNSQLLESTAKKRTGFFNWLRK